MGTVYIVQDQQRLNRITQKLERKYDFTSAERFGRLVTLLSPTARPFQPQSVVPDLRERLSKFSDGDYLLLIGNPVLIGWSVAIASEVNGGRVSVLQWNGDRGEYTPIHANLGRRSSDVDTVFNEMFPRAEGAAR